MYGTAAVLAALAAVWFLAWGRRIADRRRRPPRASPLGIAAGAWGLRVDGRRIPGNQELYRGNSSFGLIQVVQPSGSRLRFYLTDYLIQNIYDTAAARAPPCSPTCWRSWPARTRRGSTTCCASAWASASCRASSPARASRVDVVEINPAVVPVARRFFDLDPAAFDLTIGDGRWFVNQSAARYDAVILDAFVGDATPSHLMSREAFAAIARVLKPDGVLVINTFVDFGSRGDYLGASL